MTIYSNAKVEEIKRVVNSAGSKVAPATEGLQQAIRDRLSNQDGLTAFTYTTASTNPEALDPHDVPDGVTVLLQAPDTNAGKVYIGNDEAQPIEMQPAGTVTVDVTDTQHVRVKAANAGDRVGVLFEDG